MYIIHIIIPTILLCSIHTKRYQPISYSRCTSAQTNIYQHHTPNPIHTINIFVWHFGARNEVGDATALHVGALAHCHYPTLIDKWNPMPLTCNHPRPSSISAHTHSMHKMCNVIGFPISLVSFSIFMIEHITLRCRRHRRFPKSNTTSSTSKNHSRNVRPHKCDAASYLCILFCNIWPESNGGILAAAAAFVWVPPTKCLQFSIT